MKRNKVDLGKSFSELTNQELNKIMANPMLIHKIQDNLMAIKDESIMAMAIRDGAKDSPRECIKMIIDRYRDNPPMIKRIVGKETLELIEEYTGKTLADDLENLFN